MPRRANRTTPLVFHGTLYSDDDFTGTKLDSSAWFAWLTSATSFYYESSSGIFSAHHELRSRGGHYWIAYRRHAGRLHRLHLGKANQLTRERLEQAALALNPSAIDQELLMHSP